MKSNRLIHLALGTLGLLLIPLALTLLNPTASIKGGPGGGWDWLPGDFVVMGVIIFIVGLLLDLAWRKTGRYRIPAVIAIVILFLWLWVELAVGLFTNWGS